MNTKEFNDILMDQMNKCRYMLERKEKEYSEGEDRLVQFKTAASLMNIQQVQALAGMMVKHTTSIYQMVEKTARGESLPMEMWDEKITDHINYLILLKAMLEENGGKPCPECDGKLDAYTLYVCNKCGHESK